MPNSVPPPSPAKVRAMRLGVTLGILLLLVLVVGRFLLGFHSVRARAEAHPAGDGMPYEDWSETLGAIVREDSVDYAAAREAEPDIRRYAATLEAHGPRTQPALYTERAQRLAYYINAYNALVLLGVLNHWPIESVHDVRGLLAPRAGFGFFYAMRFRIDRRNQNLYDLEHLILRGFGDARMHAAINCASRSCPALRGEAYIPETLDAQLDDATRRFVSDPRHVRVDPGARVVHLSALFEWYREDFVAHAERLDVPDTDGLDPVLRFIVHFATDEVAQQLRGAAGYSLHYETYDWALNAAD